VIADEIKEGRGSSDSRDLKAAGSRNVMREVLTGDSQAVAHGLQNFWVWFTRQSCCHRDNSGGKTGGLVQKI
jgi:hypothetical protein